MSLLQGLAERLAVAGLASWRASGAYADADPWPIYLEHVPASPDRVITLTAYAAGQADSLLPYDPVRVQARTRTARDESPTVSRDRAQALYDELHGLGPITLPGGARVQLALALGTPTYLGADKNDRNEHTVNFELEILNPNRRGRSA
ncbi:MAG: minor capsid protein [Pseudonocardiaceae bacterium]